MRLTGFISDLIGGTGVTVAGEVLPFGEDDVQETIDVLGRYYVNDVIGMPHHAPAFNPQAAAWSARYLYHVIQLMLLRHLGNEQLDVLLIPFPGEIDAAAIYTTDLTFRHLPELFQLARSLAPGDPLVQRLTDTALQWPFSAAGIALPAEPALDTVLDHPSLRIAYVDRIITRRDTARCNNPHITALVLEALGAYPEKLWPELPLLLKK
ncbi:hypothetical protein F0L74_06320 [Chitinophaga agrisoli]|uniref:MoxR-vWA-beta-propeller ternary system domain-containing protein n=1 Tax=Chitinophaga agrisoli TaxID=2607653 RepID=A0A5B2W5B6_9BACT|nr:hypothetical protein [Chitinophaga agrisoli]KAA2245567.1 hypothetical protein F0L74_06320 [Chitinophaga agrisoli]